MTKEQVISCIMNTENRELILSKINTFFESNVCIPNGKTLQAKVSEGWVDIFTPYIGIEYCIKPSEPIYEWQWEYHVDNYVLITKCFYTEDEAGFDFIQIEETKRERK